MQTPNKKKKNKKKASSKAASEDGEASSPKKETTSPIPNGIPIKDSIPNGILGNGEVFCLQSTDCKLLMDEIHMQISGQLSELLYPSSEGEGSILFYSCVCLSVCPFVTKTFVTFFLSNYS